MQLAIDITKENALWDSLPHDIEQYTHDIVSKVLNKTLPNIQAIEVSVVLADNALIQKLNRDYREKDKPTNVLSFPMTDQDDLDEEAKFICLGDIIISYETITAESEEQEKSFLDHYTHMLVHGCLHLMHYDHITEELANEMEGLEIEILSSFGIKNPYEIY